MPVGTALLAATQAYSLVKQGIALYKDVRGTVGDVKGILADIDKQFAGKKISKEQAEKINEEKERVRKIAAADPNEVMGNIGEQLGAFFDAFDRVEALFWEEERNAKKVYTGGVSASRRALQRVLIRTRLQQMYAEMRTEMTWNTPVELGDLWTRFSEMRDQIEKEQEVARAEQHKLEQLEAKRREADYRARIDAIKYHAAWISGVLVIVGYMHLLLYYIEQDRIWRWGQ